jgi:uncharacterized membrane protein YidH (DUF202 family)
MNTDEPTDEPPDSGRGLQPERTALAWFRTALGFVFVAALTIRLAPEGAGLALALVTGGVVLAAVVAATATRTGQLRAVATPRSPSRWPLAALVAAVVVVDVAAIVLYR